jgi:hypothetical protein
VVKRLTGVRRYDPKPAHHKQKQGGLAIKAQGAGQRAKVVEEIFPRDKLLAHEWVVGIHESEQRAIDRAIGIQVTQVVEPIDDVGKQGKELFGRDRVEEMADVVIRGDLGHLEQGRGVTAAFGQRHVSLKLQKRSALCEKDRKPAERRVYHPRDFYFRAYGASYEDDSRVCGAARTSILQVRTRAKWGRFAVRTVVLVLILPHLELLDYECATNHGRGPPGPPDPAYKYRF